MSVVEKWLDPFSNPFSILKFAMELSILILFIILFLVFYFRIRRKTPVFMGKGYHELLLFMVVGIILYTLDVFDNWAWFTTGFYRMVWKPIKMILSFVAVLLLLLGFRRFYKFSDALFATIE